MHNQGNKVDIVLLDEADKAAEAHQQGVNLLIKYAIPSPLGHLQSKLPNKAKLKFVQDL